ncbi:MAG: class I SAM-dependent methyltransferase [Syntrophobacteraceae bacterium]
MSQGVCPVLLGHFLASPVRKLIQDPDKILTPFVRNKMTALDVGCGMGFFSIPLARLVGTEGRVICVDMQQGMLDGVIMRAKKAGVSVETRLCSQHSLGLEDGAGTIDFAIAFALAHEVPDRSRFFTELAASLAPSGRLLLAEPSGHVSEKNFAETVEIAEKNGLAAVEAVQVPRSRAVLMGKAS